MTTLAHRLSAMGRKSKFRNVPTVVDGLRFASRAEAKRYRELRLLERAGEIDHLECQPAFNLKICKYIADFKYREIALGRIVVEDVKGVQTADFKLKWKLVQELFHGFEFRLYPPRDIKARGRAG